VKRSPACHCLAFFLLYCDAGGVPDGIVPEGGVPEGAVPFTIPPGGVPEGMVPEGVTPEGALPFIIPAGGVPEGTVLFSCPLICGVPDGAAAAVSMVSTGVGVDGVTTVPADCCEALVVLCVQPAIRITAMRSADPISMSILLLFMEFIT